jgi:hypothetical protein
VDILDVAYHLSNVIPNIIAKRYSPKDAKGIRVAQLKEIKKSILTARFNEIKKSKKEWLAERS